MPFDRTVLSPYLRLVHDFVTPAEMAFGPIAPVDHALHYFKRGEGDYTLDGVHYTIESGTVFFVRPGVSFHFRAAAKTNFHMLNIHFDALHRADSTAMRSPYQPKSVKRRFAEREIIDSLPGNIAVNKSEYEWQFARLLACHGLEDMVSFLQMRSALLDILALLYRAARSESIDLKFQRHQTYVNAAIQFIRAHYHEPIRLDDIAAAASISPSHLLAMFKAVHGTSPTQLVAQLRIEQAKNELAMSNAPIKEIAHRAGFQSIHHFTRTFTQKTGISPARFRQVAALPEK